MGAFPCAKNRIVRAGLAKSFRISDGFAAVCTSHWDNPPFSIVPGGNRLFR